jgi:hypothetical protein
MLFFFLTHLKFENFPSLKRLETNHSEDPFGDFDVSEKLQLLRVLCEHLLYCAKFEFIKEKIEKSVETSRASILDHKEHLAKLMKVSHEDFIKYRRRILNEAAKST